MKKTLGFLLGALLALTLAAPALLVGASPVQAQTLGQDDLFGGIDATEFAETAGLGSGDLTTTIASIIRTVMGFLGIVAVVIILYGGFMWMTAGGTEKRLADAKKILISGIIGLVIVISAFAIASFVITNIAGVTAG